ncbi:MAG: hypothetical protein A2312_03030 [Candidatus Staskawiczbacteria bacterium RIFOXYB2_FULL_32_9]|uniref:Uncharacterized protein n=1 Tax=Candidatus Staskawiczbacteria bacterium RIFOXYD1_FULL_32_13 TaxID=1802234 RepID=A0A1G2JPJ0_9BACT|nr:MAG: hypothetical protein UR22_C0002G0058 [Parcubacteria group bacterium GW2011_GWC2_32_10]OGZ78659.1 MAG: hypothetical protein A2360_00495 [Candidatus Staskawiczbacteria bacterium RIFOXYB1_FULL_32_11]OGZ81548.1 MAG: hypothetical protein A2312_03030 [Candidatus Staskawiczbacteria bacterium RIFOXYB2_FULL_32_9]OGZ86898.1 MAG: hypothetical protein A2463_01980 [Candidatus Staskawiczbacteria bacterium RIFOXYC2_FULL_32_10]OGZ88178.1 MAG: hypothetical protein A2561_05235 [Candidatus Staskawiczbacte
MAKFQKWGMMHTHDMRHAEGMRCPYCEDRSEKGWDLCNPGVFNYVVGYDILYDDRNVVIFECPRCSGRSWFHWRAEEQKFPQHAQTS